MPIEYFEKKIPTVFWGKGGGGGKVSGLFKLCIAAGGCVYLTLSRNLKLSSLARPMKRRKSDEFHLENISVSI